MASLEGALYGVQSLYEIPDDDLVGEVIVPAMTVAEEVRIAAGYFSSRCLAQIAPGLATFLTNREDPLHLLISPELLPDDKSALERGLTSPQEVLENAVPSLFTQKRLTSSALINHTIDCLAWLVSSNRLHLRFVLMEQGMYHKKQWLFRTGTQWAAVHGSGNASTRGLLVNGEQMTVDRPWLDGPSVAERVANLIHQWDRQWTNRHSASITLEIEQGILFAGEHPRHAPPTVDDFWRSWQEDREAGLEPPLPPNLAVTPQHVLSIPQDLEWRSGPFKHQGQAVDQFQNAGGRGIMTIATGGGKTKAALIAATQFQDQHNGPMLIAMLVPTTPLLHQWADECRAFGISPTLPSSMNKAHRQRRLEEIIAALRGSTPRTEVVIFTNALFSQDPSWRDAFNHLGSNVQTMIIGDEVHNLGVPSFLNNLPGSFNLRLGLSATPIRQYDPDGTEDLFSFFGPPCFDFGLGDAINAGCLVPYRYNLHEVQLTPSEMQKYEDLTAQLWAAGFRIDDDGRTIIANPRVEKLLRDRRAVLEQAEGKLPILRDQLLNQNTDQVKRTLIYTSAKGAVHKSRRQIEDVNNLLSDLGIVSHQFTSAETSRADAELFLERFGNGDYQVLTAMKVLDEGIDIPQTDTAYLLASSTVQREWVQRRGRILRPAPNKTHATLHDFLVVPPDPTAPEGRSLLRGELARAEAFAKLAENEWMPQGPRPLLTQYEDLAWTQKGD